MSEETNIITSLSNQGYAIYKNKISDTEIEEIRKDMTITPFTCPGYGNEEDIQPYNLYKENSDKIYVPYFYGRNKFGPANKIKLPDPEQINIQFASNRPMRPYQQDIIKTYIDHAKKIGGGIISVGCGRGKCLAEGTIIPLFNGTSKPVEDLQIGDQLIGDDGTPRNIISLGSGKSQLYQIAPKNKQDNN